MAIVTIRGTLGSGAPEIGKQIAERLHFDYVDREIIADVAKRNKWSEESTAAKEMPPGTLGGRIAEALAHTYPIGDGFGGAYLPTWEIPLDNTLYLVGLESVIKELAQKQAIVIRGRGSQFILKDFLGALHVLVVAPLLLRVKRIMESSKVEESEARKMAQLFDSSRRVFTKRFFHGTLEDPINYDLVINTEHLTFENATNIITTALPSKDISSVNNKR
jgi:cytidylate kinase